MRSGKATIPTTMLFKMKAVVLCKVPIENECLAFGRLCRVCKPDFRVDFVLTIAIVTD